MKYLILVLLILGISGCDEFGRDLKPLPVTEVVSKIQECEDAGLFAQTVRRNKIVIWVNCFQNPNK